MVKVLHVHKTFYSQSAEGVDRYIYNICKATEPYGITHTVLCTTPSATKEISILNGVMVIKYPQALNLSSWLGAFRMLLCIKEEARYADVIHYHCPWPLSYWRSLFASGKKTVVTYHSDIVRSKIFGWLFYPIEQYFLRSVDGIISVSGRLLGLSSNLKEFVNKTEVVPLTISKDDYPKPNLSECHSIRKKFGRFYLCLCKLDDLNDVEVLLEAMQEMSSVHLVIVSDKRMRDSLRKICKRKSVGHVAFIENTSEQAKVDYLHACFGVIALPGAHGGGPADLSLLEGAMFQKPLISCYDPKESEAPRINKDLDTGLVVPLTSADLKVAMVKLSKAPNLADQMGARALKRFETQFNYDAIGRKLAGMYR